MSQPPKHKENVATAEYLEYIVFGHRYTIYATLKPLKNTSDNRNQHLF